MSKTPAAAQDRSDNSATGSEAPAPRKRPPGMTPWRENVESAVTVLLVFFLLRTFQAEGFEIPTGSMGPTLMGRHKDLTCEKCGFPYQVGSSEEIDQETGRRKQGSDTSVGVCPVCRYRMHIGPNDEHPERSYRGDRIGVDKMRYRLAEPQRWEVVVFKCPERAGENYIKRLVGLPGETLQIFGGDLFTRPIDSEDPKGWTMARKPPDVVRAMMQPVADSQHIAEGLIAAGWPTPWQADAGSGWKAIDSGRQYEVDAGAETAWLRFVHRPASFAAWGKVDAGETLTEVDIAKPQLITDFCAFNTGPLEGRSPDGRYLGALGLHWVGDLTLDVDFRSESDAGQLTLQLVEDGRQFGARFDLKTGQVTLSDSARPDFAAQALTTVRGPGAHRVGFSNVDDQLIAWVDGKPVAFGEPTTFQLETVSPTPADLAPASIGAQDAKIVIERVALHRDAYHIADSTTSDRLFITDWKQNPALLNPLSESSHARFFSDPAQWGVFADERVYTTYDLEQDQFFMMGDNSPNSWDTRFWTEPDDHFVSRDLLVGRAVCVYWPHGWSAPISVRVPGTEIDVPFYPNFKRMRLIH